MAGSDVAYRGSLLINIVDVQDLEIASFGAWDDPNAESFGERKQLQLGYRRLLWHAGGDRLTGAIILGMSHDLWKTNDVGMLKGLVHSGAELGPWKEPLCRNPWEIKTAYIASGNVGRMLPETVLGQPSTPAHEVAGAAPVGVGAGTRVQ
jgi:hypothetical protein